MIFVLICGYAEDTTMRCPPFLIASCLYVFLLDTQKDPKRCPLLAIAREARLRGCSPLRTPKRRSRSQKAKPCRSAARFLTLFYFSPIDPSGVKTGRRRLAAIVLAAKRAASEQRDFFASFLVTKRKALMDATHNKRASPHGGDARKAETSIKNTAQDPSYR